MTYQILHGNNLDILPTLADNSIDSIVTDPPYELGFMGKKWDSSGIAYSVKLWQQCLRVLKPGGHLLSFGGTRTWHRVAVAIEDAGFEIRDNIARFYGDPAYCQCDLPQVDWVYGTGEPQSQHSMRPVPDGNLSQTFDPENQQGQVLQSQLQEQDLPSGKRPEPSQGSKDGKEPSLEGRSDIQATQGQLLGCEVCEVSSGVSSDGQERRLHHGTQACNCQKDRQVADSNRGSESQGPQSQQQPPEQFGTVPNQRGSQERRGWPICVGCGKPLSTTNAGHIAWVMGSGFPKSLDVSKAIDKAAGAEREVIGEKVSPDGIPYSARIVNKSGPQIGGSAYGDFQGGGNQLTAPSTPEAQQWQGWGTALKPAFEPVIVARKPIEGNVANNVLKWGTGGLNIDGSRIASDITKDPNYRPNAKDHAGHGSSFSVGGQNTRDKNDLPDAGFHNSAGRWPANIILDPYTAELLDEQSGTLKSGKLNTAQTKTSIFGSKTSERFGTYEQSEGGASRFFYVAKASKRDRNEGLEDLDAQRHSDRELADGVGGDNPRNRTNQAKQNFHPTVKPTSLMEYLIKLVTPPKGTVLDPFTGSGSTGKAAILQGFDFIGIEMTEEYLPIIKGRLKHAERIVAERNKEASLLEQEKLF